MLKINYFLSQILFYHRITGQGKPNVVTHDEEKKTNLYNK